MFDVAFVGLELWQVKAGSYFDNILITSDVQGARKEAQGASHGLHAAPEGVRVRARVCSRAYLSACLRVSVYGRGRGRVRVRSLVRDSTCACACVR